MKRIGLLSDTHGLFDDSLRDFFADVDELWHAGDFGTQETADAIASFKPLIGVYGNIDGGTLRVEFPKWQTIRCEGVTAMMTHIGGYPNRYEPGIADILRENSPQIFISGHSHILKVVYDKKLDLLHMNPGAAGIYGFHHVRTAMRFIIDGENIKDLEVGEWPKGFRQ